MNPIDASNPTDRAKYRQNYMANLALEHSNNTLNLNANQHFKSTGQTPAQMLDNRTITEKYTDLERLKVELRSGLMGLTDGTNANQIVEALTPAELMFATTQFPFIVQDLKPKFQLGIPAPIFLSYLRRLIEKFDVTEGVDFGLQQSTGRDILLGQQQILYNMVNKDDLRALNSAIGLIPIQIANSASIRNLIREVREELRIMERAIPDARDMERLDQLPIATKADIQVLLNEALKTFPTRDQIRTDLESLNNAIQLGDERLIGSILRAIRGDIEIDNASINQLRRVDEAVIATPVREGGARFPPAEAPERPVMGSLVVGDGVNSVEDFNRLPLSNKKSFLTQTGLSTGVRFNGKKVAMSALRAGETPSNGVFWKDTNILDLVDLWVAEKQRAGKNPKKYEDATGGFSGEGLIPKMKGKGLAHKMEGQVVKPKMYASFGAIVINKYKLEKGILMLRQVSGNALVDIPTHRINEGLKDILKTIVNGHNPTFESINELPDSDKSNLHKILYRARLLEKIAVPKPKEYSDNEKEMNRFDILRGEIMAGNDNKHLVKEFKVLLVRLMNRGVVPKRQAHDILIDITSMGL